MVQAKILWEEPIASTFVIPAGISHGPSFVMLTIGKQLSGTSSFPSYSSDTHKIITSISVCFLQKPTLRTSEANMNSQAITRKMLIKLTTAGN